MLVVSGTIPYMAKKPSTSKPNGPDPGGQKRGRPKSRTRKVSVSARLDPGLYDATMMYIDSVRPKTDLTAVFELALEELLKSKGFWPPKPPPKDAPA